MPLKYIWKHWFNRKHELVALSAILIISTLISRYVAIEHWESLGWCIEGVSPWAPYFVLIYASCTMGILYIRRIKSIGLWGIAIIALIYGLTMFWVIELSGQNEGILNNFLGW